MDDKNSYKEVTDNMQYRVHYYCILRHDYKKEPCKKCNFRSTAEDRKDHPCMFNIPPIEWLW